MQYILLTLGYFLIIPLSKIISGMIKNWWYQKRRRNRVNQPRQNKTPKTTFSQNAKKWNNFGMKESSKKGLIKIIYVVSILIAPAISFFNLYAGILTLIIAPVLFIAVNYLMINKELKERENLLSRMLEFKRAKMGFVNKDSDINSYQNEFVILEWDPNDHKPSKIRIMLPVNFDPINATSFLGDFSIQFGRGRPFELDETDKEFPGWDTEIGRAHV